MNVIDPGSAALLLTACFIGVTHTLMGPDHYLPFVALGKARKWSLRWTLLITFLCGVGHVAGSVALGAIGLAAGWSLGGLEAIESFRGEIAAWLLIILGLLYIAWALTRRGRSHSHTHWHAHADGDVHNHEHTHQADHAHPHPTGAGIRNTTTAWSLFIIFVLGPCEAFIPLLLFPAFQQNGQLAIATTVVFAVSTIATMMASVAFLSMGLRLFPANALSRHGHVLAGFTIFACGAAIHFGL